MTTVATVFTFPSSEQNQNFMKYSERKRAAKAISNSWGNMLEEVALLLHCLVPETSGESVSSTSFSNPTPETATTQPVNETARKEVIKPTATKKFPYPPAEKKVLYPPTDKKHPYRQVPTSFEDTSQYVGRKSPYMQLVLNQKNYRASSSLAKGTASPEQAPPVQYEHKIQVSSAGNATPDLPQSDRDIGGPVWSINDLKEESTTCESTASESTASESSASSHSLSHSYITRPQVYLCSDTSPTRGKRILRDDPDDGDLDEPPRKARRISGKE